MGARRSRRFTFGRPCNFEFSTTVNRTSRIRRSAGFQPAVSPISNRQGVFSGRCSLNSGVCRLEALRYSRLETLGITHIFLWVALE
jgi:hypothetical protein